MISRWWLRDWWHHNKKIQEAGQVNGLRKRQYIYEHGEIKLLTQSSMKLYNKLPEGCVWKREREKGRADEERGIEVIIERKESGM